MGCPKCYSKTYSTVALKSDGAELVCSKNPSHVFVMDAQGFPRSKK
ncbi:MAG: hypothetical protein ABIA76_00550 [Candidatus Diapherotrites archaeon]